MGVYGVDGEPVLGAYDISKTLLALAYDVNGTAIPVGDFEPDYDNYTMTSLYNLNVSNCQGIAIYNDVLFQFRASGTSLNDTVCLFNYSTGGDISRDMMIESDHGDSATFSPEFYDSGDEFPLLYITADTSPAKIYINRVTRSSAQLVKTLLFPISAGYYGAGAFDFENDIAYLLAYKENNYQTDDGGQNTTVVSKWDLSDLTDNGDGTFTPGFISQYERPFIYTMQGLAYHDGYIWICSGNVGTSYVYAMTPDTGTIEHTVTLDTVEIEGADFLSDGHGGYYMVTGQQNGVYKKYTFGIKEKEATS